MASTGDVTAPVLPERYDEVARLIEEEAGRPSQRSLHGQQIIEKYGDANWHRADKMAEALQPLEAAARYSSSQSLAAGGARGTGAAPRRNRKAAILAHSGQW